MFVLGMLHDDSCNTEFLYKTFLDSCKIASLESDFVKAMNDVRLGLSEKQPKNGVLKEAPFRTMQVV